TYVGLGRWDKRQSFAATSPDNSRLALTTMPGTSGMEASFWCYACSRLRRPCAQGEPVAGCTRCGTPAAALEGIVDVVDAGAFVHACHPEAGLIKPPAPSLPTVTIRAAGRDCAVCMEELKPGVIAAVTPCEHVYHPPCVAPWLQARGTCPLCRAPVAGASDRDGLVTCRFPSGRIGLGRRVAGRIHGVRMLDEGGKLVRPRVLQRGFKGVHLHARMTLGALVSRDLDVVPDV
uniref:RING-type domain-containing protein n=1 Tax=Setaria italica TaxID=4555 RepID=K3XR74_SETIT